MNVEFDPAKDGANRRKHGVSLCEAEGALYDPLALTVEDRDHGEPRFVTLGTDTLGRLLVVAWTWRDETTIRLISARRAQPHERKAYEG